MKSLKQSLLAIFSGVFIGKGLVSTARAQLLVYASIIASVVSSAGSSSAQSASAEPTLWGIYGVHNRHDCPVNNRETAKEVIEISMTDLQPLMKKYGITSIEDMYHSGLEHTLVWVVKTARPHDLEEFTIELGVARWNDLKFVPERTFADVITDITALHGLEDFKPVIESVPFSAKSGLAGSNSAETTLWGIYGAHNRHDCPVNNRETAKEVIETSMTDLQPLMNKYGITSIEDMYHSGLEHTLVWVVKTTRPHDLEEFTIELGVARWNDLKFVPERTFADVITDVRALHGLEDWEPEAVTKK